MDEGHYELLAIELQDGGSGFDAGTLAVGQAQALQQTFVSALHAAFVVCAALAAIGVTAIARGR